MIQNPHSSDDDARDSLPALMQVLTAGTPVDDVLDLVVARVCSLLHVEEAMVLLVQDDRLILRASCSTEETHLPRPLLLDGTSVENWVLRHNVPLVVPAISRDGRFLAGPGYRSSLSSLAAVPIRGDATLIGVLEVGAEIEHDFSANIALLETLADIVGLVVARERATQRTRRALVEEFLRTVRHDLKSPLTAIHGYAQLVQRRAAREDRAADMQTGAIIMEQAQRMLSMINSWRSDGRHEMRGVEDAAQDCAEAQPVR